MTDQKHRNEPMTVAQLITSLSAFPQDTKVVLHSPNVEAWDYLTAENLPGTIIKDDASHVEIRL